MRRAPALLLVCALLAAPVGCGGSGTEQGATVSVYVTRPLCPGARQALARRDGRAGGFVVRMVCLSADRQGKRLDLATIGAGARRATEDSAAVGYIGERPAARFARPILESAGIASLHGSSGAAAMSRLLRAVRQAGSTSNLRESVLNGLAGS